MRLLMGKIDEVGDFNRPQYTPKELQQYKEDYQKGFDLFQKAFKEYSAPNMEPHKKAQLQKVMSEGLQVMNETACVAIKKEKLDDEKRLTESYAEFIEDPKIENQKKVLENINALKK